MIAPRQYALAITRDGRLLGFVGSRPEEWSALGIEMARKFATGGDAWTWLADARGEVPGLAVELVGLVTGIRG